MTQRQHNREWDTRAWLIGILGGAAGGSLAASKIYSVILRGLSNFTDSSFTQHCIADAIVYSLTAMILLVLPGLLSGLARRLTFLWGLLPLSLFLVSASFEDWIVNGNDVADFFWARLAFIFACLVISSGPVSLIRWRRVRAARHHTTLLASYQAQRGAALGPQEGVWPPPPEDREEREI